jgi:hypothetical protein
MTTNERAELRWRRLRDERDALVSRPATHATHRRVLELTRKMKQAERVYFETL